MSKLAEDRAFVADGAIDELLQHAAQIPESAKRSEAETALNNVKNDLAVVAAEVRNVAMGDSEAAKTTAAKTRAAEEGLAKASDIILEESIKRGTLPVDVAESFSAAVTAVTDTANAVEATRTEGRTAAGQKGRVAGFAMWLSTGFAVAYLILWFAVLDSAEERIAAGIALVVLGFGLVELYLSGSGSFGPMLKGSDGRYSTSKLQVALWTLIVTAILGYLALLVALGAFTEAEVGLTTEQVDDYLILLGGPFAAAVLTKLATTSKVENGSIQKTTAPSTDPAQVVQNDSGSTDLIDAQYLLFNLVAMTYVLVAFFRSGSLPAIPAVLLALAGVSAATYTSNKALLRNAPSILSVTPLTVRPGDAVTVAGINFMPSTGVEASKPRVLLTDVAGELMPGEDASDTRLKVRIPIGLQPQTYELRVRSTAKVLTPPYQVTVIADQPVLVGPVGSELKPGQPMTLVGRYLLPPGPDAAANRAVSVVIDGTSAGVVDVMGAAGQQQEVTIDLPQTTASGPHQVSIRRQSVESNQVRVEVT